MYLGGRLKRKAMQNCVLCGNAPCDEVCPRGIKPGRQLRSLWFDNETYAAANLPNTGFCVDCNAPCEAACIKSGQVPIKEIVTTMAQDIRPRLDIPMPRDESALNTDLCGIPLENPFLLSSSVVSSSYDMCARAFEAGWAGAAFKTICAFEIHESSPRYSAIRDINGTIMGFKNVEQLSEQSVTENMDVFRNLKTEYPTKCIIASIMGRDEKEWEELAHLCQENGADAIELNFSCPNMMAEGLGSDIGQDPDLVERLTAAARRGARIPILAKLTPNVDRMSPAAEAAKRGGANGISAINTIKSVLGVNMHTFVSSPDVKGRSAVGGYSGNAIKPIALRFITELGKNKNLSDMHISGMGGVETWRDALDFILLGASSVQMTTAVMQYGNRIIDDLKSGLNYYLQEKGFSSVQSVVGLGLDSVSETTDILERDTVIYPKINRKTCIGCGRCEISCADGGRQAIRLDNKRRPILDGKKCVGCHLCTLVCPTDSIRSSGKRIRK